MNDTQLYKTIIMSALLKDGEQIRNIKGFEGRYYISNYGEVYSLYSHRQLKKQIVRGYYCVWLYDGSGNRYKRKLNRLTAEYFCANDNPQDKTQVHHIDGNSLNDKYDNLIWVSQNEHHKIHNGKACVHDGKII